MWAAWTDYEAISHFETREDGEAWLTEVYGPDQSRWPTLFEVEPEHPKGITGEKKYIAVAWWPDWQYNGAPDGPCVTSAWGKEPYVRPNPARTYRAESATSDEEARAAASALAVDKEHPDYEEKFSSATTSGTLPVFVKRGVTKVDTGWKTQAIYW